MPLYNPSHFRVEDTAALHDLIRAYPFATLITGNAADPFITHLPLMLDVDGDAVTLRGHVARANGHWKAVGDGIDATVVFSGPQAYITPQWYPSKLKDGKVVPTWNYQVVHAHGRLRAVQDETWLRRMVADLTTEHEKAFAHQWAVTDAPDDYIDKMIGAIVGLELTVTRLEGKFKLSQNKSAADHAGIVNGLAARGDAGSTEVSRVMAR